jgi:hypothetical protein
MSELTPLQKKALIHARDLLKSFDNMPQYREVSRTLETFGIADAQKKAILDVVDESMHSESKKIREATDWLNSLIS